MKFTVSLAQIAVSASDLEENLKKGEAMIKEAARRRSDIVCFPEMWTTGFDWKRNEHIAGKHEKVIDYIAGLAKQNRIWISGSMLSLDENSKLSNASILFDPAGVRRAVYRKTHLFGAIGENTHMAAGKSLCMVDAPWGATGLSICYDIRFPEIFRTYALKGTKMILSPMAFPHPKLHHWKTLVRARAIENQLFMVGTNQVGSEKLDSGRTIEYCGSSVIVDPWGDTVVEGSEAKEELLTAALDMERVNDVRNSMDVFKDRRPDLYDLR